MVQADSTRSLTGALLIMDPWELRSQLTWVPGFASTSIQAVTSSWGDLLEVQEVDSKKDSPCIIPTLFKAEAVKWTKEGRPAKTEAESFTALVFDFDSTASAPDWKASEPVRCVEAEDLEAWLEEHGLAGIYWTTWKSQVGSLRWRLVLPLDGPYAARAHEEAWKFWAKRLDSAVGRVDWCPRTVTSLHALPAVPKSRRFGDDDWGGMTPNPVFVEGSLLSPKDAEAKANLHHYANSLKRGASRKGEKWARVKGAVITPYQGDGESPEVSKTLALWAETRGIGSKGTTSFAESLNAIAALRVRGLNSKKGSQQGSVLYAAWWNMYRMGFDAKHMHRHLEPLVENAGPKYLAEFLAHSKNFGKEANPWLAQALELMEEVPPEFYRAAFQQFLRIFARAQHLHSDKGGQMAMEQIAVLIGVSNKLCVYWRAGLEEKGLLTKSGENVTRRYHLVLP